MVISHAVAFLVVIFIEMPVANLENMVFSKHEKLNVKLIGSCGLDFIGRDVFGRLLSICQYDRYLSQFCYRQIFLPGVIVVKFTYEVLLWINRLYAYNTFINTCFNNSHEKTPEPICSCNQCIESN